MTKHYDIVYNNSLVSCVVCWFPLLVNCESVYAAILISSGIYYISRIYSCNISINLNTLYVIKTLHIIFMWSIYMFNNLPKNVV